MRREQLVVELPELLALELVAGGTGHIGGLDGTRAEDRKILEDEAQFGFGLHQLAHVVERPFTISAIVIEELDQGDLPLRVAKHDLVRRVEQFTRLLVDDLLTLGGLLLLLTTFEFGHGLLEHLGVLQQVFLHETPDLGSLCRGELTREGRYHRPEAHDGRGQKARGQQSGTERR